MRKYQFVILFGLFFIVSCVNNGKLPKNGENCELNQECLSAIDEESFSELNKVCTQKDENRLKKMIIIGSVYILKPFYECKMVNTQYAKSKIHVKDSADNEYEVWVSNEFIKKIP